MKKSKWFAVGIVALISAPALAQEGGMLPELHPVQEPIHPVSVENRGVTILSRMDGGTVYNSRALDGQDEKAERRKLKEFLSNDKGCLSEKLAFATVGVRSISFMSALVKMADPNPTRFFVRLNHLSVLYLGAKKASEEMSVFLTPHWEIITPPGVQKGTFCADLLKQGFDLACSPHFAERNSVILTGDKIKVEVIERAKEGEVPGRLCLRENFEMKFGERNILLLEGVFNHLEVAARAIQSDHHAAKVRAEEETARLEKLRQEEELRLKEEHLAKERKNKAVDQLIEEIGTRDSKASSEAAI